MRRVVVGTAGHIDHGKTRLVEALTGVDCDRWAEEKARGITIDLGFAALREGDLQVGFVDVPGHERFLHNALAGLGGIRLVLLVVAADEGVKPQTEEHLAICSLLGIPAGLVALTKCDLVEPDLAEMAELEVGELLAGTPFAGAPVHRVSSRTGEGLPELRAALVALAEGHLVAPTPGLPARLPVDRAFHLKGLGLVVTGTLVSGSIGPGDELELLPPGRPARVRSVQVHGEDRERAEAGERTSLRLAGVELESVARGMQLIAPGAFAASRSLAARFTLLPDAPRPLKGFTNVRLHLYSGEVMGKLRPLAGELAPGAMGPVEIRLAGPAVAVRGDRFVVRRPSPQSTLGGGSILDPAWRRHRGRDLEAALAALAGDREEALVFWVGEAGEGGVAAPELARRLGLEAREVEAALAALAREQRVLEAPAGSGSPRRWLAPGVARAVMERAETVLAELLRRDRLARGMAKAEAVKRIFPGRGGELAGVYLGWLEAQGKIALDGDLLTLPGRGARLTPQESSLAAAALARLEAAGLTPPSPGELAAALEAKPQILEGVLRYLVEGGSLTRLPNDLLVASSALEGLRRELEATGWERFTVPRFKERFALTRKWAIPLLEHLDSTGATRRVGDERLVVR